MAMEVLALKLIDVVLSVAGTVLADVVVRRWRVRQLRRAVVLTPRAA